ncbi:hypothetical protein [Nocardiopsis sp. NRRL B-16309]|uniref:hypothetical protein n=1 Tax=Nocardiopsis sp. NRRL B-16309 TaxID=1519494 RepID=UPI000AC78848|nr:hypothetical protein [Nocardiopsis sp. NRRL B-16309]
MITIRTTVHDPAEESVAADPGISVHYVHGSSVAGVHPFVEEAHELTLAVGDHRQLWYDGRQWRVGQNGWGASYADRVIRWDALNELDTEGRYVISDEGDAVVLKAT